MTMMSPINLKKNKMFSSQMFVIKLILLPSLYGRLLPHLVSSTSSGVLWSTGTGLEVGGFWFKRKKHGELPSHMRVGRRTHV